jgi:formate dehydrogenase subunit gamma
MALDTTETRHARLEAILDAHAGREGPLLPILHDVQAAFGCVPAETIPRIADRLNLTRAEVHGVVSFYHDFRDEPAGRVVVKICRAEACKAVGSDALAAAAEARCGVTMGGTAPGGAVTLESVYCLGLCACGPAAMVDGEILGRMDAARLDAALTERGA